MLKNNIIKRLCSNETVNQDEIEILTTLISF
jgi:hypothetical protein